MGAQAQAGGQSVNHYFGQGVRSQGNHSPVEAAVVGQLSAWGGLCGHIFGEQKGGAATGQSCLHVGVPGQTGSGGDDVGQASDYWGRNTPTRGICCGAFGVTVYLSFT